MPLEIAGRVFPLIEWAEVKPIPKDLVEEIEILLLDHDTKETMKCYIGYTDNFRMFFIHFSHHEDGSIGDLASLIRYMEEARSFLWADETEMVFLDTHGANLIIDFSSFKDPASRPPKCQHCGY